LREVSNNTIDSHVTF